MRLLNVHTELLESYFDTDVIPKYAILSHTWGEDEVTFSNLQDGSHKSKLGYRKIKGCCAQALAEGYDYVWVDTCCIEKKDLSELSEAINSMYRWYRESAVCYVYLADVQADEEGHIDICRLEKSRWFTRGWTLQELLAPSNVVFFDQEWRAIGFMSKDSRSYPVPDITSMLSVITRIDDRILRNRRFMHTATAAEKFSWAAHRQTTRKEDMAYCLLGILGVTMPPLYGEGERAFIRLQQQYIQQYNDPTLLLWGFGMPCQDLFWKSTSDWALSPFPSLFSGFSQSPIIGRNDVPFTFTYTNNGVEIELLLLDFDQNVKLACFGDAEFLNRYGKSLKQNSSSPLLPFLQRLGKRRMHFTELTVMALPLLYCPTNSMLDFDVYERAVPLPPFLIPEHFCWDAKWTRVCLKGSSFRPTYIPPHSPLAIHEYGVNTKMLVEAGFSVEAVYPPAHIVCLSTRVILLVRSKDCQRFLLIFKGPNGLCFGLFIEYQFENGELLDTHRVLGEMTTADLIHHFLPHSGALSKRARKKAWVGIRRALQGKQNDEASSLEIPGKQLGNPEIAYAIVSAHLYTEGKGKLDSVKFQWEEIK
ncbi:HET-domain-containing protein [Annulohypoxylon moriforme]|nr:HET-domain-containing protein [Annulohypoxylon moriforme]